MDYSCFSEDWPILKQFVCEGRAMEVVEVVASSDLGSWRISPGRVE